MHFVGASCNLAGLGHTAQMGQKCLPKAKDARPRSGLGPCCVKTDTWETVVLLLWQQLTARYDPHKRYGQAHWPGQDRTLSIKGHFAVAPVDLLNTAV